MPLLWLGGAAIIGSIFTAVGGAVNNITEPTKNVKSPGVVANNAGIPDIIKWPLIIAGTVVAIKYGSKLIKKV
jgi:hypothetical protein